jgi:hypothetical protein
MIVIVAPQENAAIWCEAQQPFNGFQVFDGAMVKLVAQLEKQDSGGAGSVGQQRCGKYREMPQRKASADVARP